VKPEDDDMRVLSFFDLHDIKGIRWSRQHLGRMIKAGRFPKPLKIGDATVAWAEDEIDAWLGGRMVERDQNHTAA
jgi:prophage regulatory protein